MKESSEKFSDAPFILPVLSLLLLRTASLYDHYLSASLGENILSQTTWLQLLDGSVNIKKPQGHANNS